MFHLVYSFTAISQTVLSQFIRQMPIPPRLISISQPQAAIPKEERKKKRLHNNKFLVPSIRRYSIHPPESDDEDKERSTNRKMKAERFRPARVGLHSPTPLFASLSAAFFKLTLKFFQLFAIATFFFFLFGSFLLFFGLGAKQTHTYKRKRELR